LRSNQEVGVPGYASLVNRTLQNLVVPQGYTLSIAGSFGIAAYSYGSPQALDVAAFVAGAVVAFVLLATLSSGSKRIPVTLPVRSLALWNLVPVLVLPLVLALDQVIPERTLGFLTSGFAAAASYITLVSAFFRVVADRRPVEAALTGANTGRGRQPPEP
jgi:hypothetical protein